MPGILFIAASAAVGAIGGYVVPKLAGWFRREPCLTLRFPVHLPTGKKRTSSLQSTNDSEHTDNGVL